MDTRTLRRVITGVVPAGVAALLLISLVLMSGATEGSARFGELFSVLLVVNAVGLLSMAALIGWNLVRLLRQVAQRRPGARLTVRMVALFALLSVTPVVVVYYFSLQFLHRGIDSWFDVRVEQALDDALALSRTALEERMRELLSQTERMSGELAATPSEGLSVALEDTRLLSGASELTVLDSDGRISATSNIDPTAMVPERPAESILLQLRQSGDYIGLDAIGDTGALHVRVVVTIPGDVPTVEPRILQALFPVTERMDALAQSVRSTYAKYRELAYLRKPLKTSFTLTLSLVLLLSLFTAVWAAFSSARRMVAPLRDLAQGTRAVAAGDYETQLPAQTARDEVGFLVDSFNEMTRRLAHARDEARRSQRQVEEQRHYLEAVLVRLSSGVLTLDQEHRIFTANQAAEQILGIDLTPHLGERLEDIARAHAWLEPFEHVLATRLSAPREPAFGTGDWRQEVALTGPEGRRILLASGTALPGTGSPFTGHVIVFDDITALVQAQRDAAWSEVARRLAHEIKNPLTPIQLSAERLRHKYLPTMAPEEAETLDRLTRTIVQQVEAMKSMVNAFSGYARTPKMQPQEVNLNGLVADVVELYRSGDGPERIDLALEAELPHLVADPDRVRQLLHNLIKNAVEAGGSPHEAEVRVSTRRVREGGRDLVEIAVRDRGPGFPAEILDQVFEPYVTTKPKGTGLGLAIVKRIAEEHGGSVRAENEPDGGANVRLRLPVTAAEQGVENAPSSRRRAV